MDAQILAKSREMIKSKKAVSDRKMWREMEAMTHLEYELPDGVRDLEWVRKVVDETPYKAYRAARRVLSGLDERPSLTPPSETEEARAMYNDWEDALRCQMMKAAKRRASFREDVMGSAVLYDTVVAQVIHLPTQIAAIKKLGGKTTRQEAALRYGDFVVIPHNPGNVYVRQSGYMTEAVLSVKKQTLGEIVDFYNVPALKELIKEDITASFDTWVLYDYWDYDRHVIWAVRGEDNTATCEEDAVQHQIMDVDWSYPFIPWAFVEGGSLIDGQGHPLLYAPWKSNSWETSNVVGTLTVSEAIATFAKPKERVNTTNPDGIIEDMTTPGGRTTAPPGTQFQDVPDRGLDPAMSELMDRFQNGVQEATIPRMLMTAEAQAGEAFAGYNLRMQTAIGQLLPYQRLAGRWYEEVYTIMLLYAHYTGNDIEGYKKVRGANRQVKISWADIDPNNIEIEVKLEPDVPTDRMAKAQTAINLNQALKYPTKDALEALGETDPEGMMQEWQREQIKDAVLGGYLQRLQMQISGQLEQIVQQAAGEIAMQQQQALQQQMQQGGAPASSMQQPGMAPGGMPGVEGQGFNPAMGGSPPTMASPIMNTFEGQTGTTRSGEEIMP